MGAERILISRLGNTNINIRRYMSYITSSVRSPVTNSFNRAPYSGSNSASYSGSNSGSYYGHGSASYDGRGRAAYGASASYDGHGSASYDGNVSAYETRLSKHNKARKQKALDEVNPTNPAFWNPTVSPMDSREAWIEMEWQAWRNAQVNASGSYEGDGFFEVR